MEKNISELFGIIENSGLSELQKMYLALKMLEILNNEKETAEHIRTKTYETSTKQEKKSNEKALAKKYGAEIDAIQKKFAGYFETVFDELYADEKISEIQRVDSITHYCKGKSLTYCNSDRSTLQKKLREILRGFSGSVR